MILKNIRMYKIAYNIDKIVQSIKYNILYRCKLIMKLRSV